MTFEADLGCHHRVHPPVAAFSSVRPGGATCPVAADDIRHAGAAADGYAAWYAPAVLGGPLSQWAEVATAGAGLHRVGHCSQNLLSGGF